MNAYVATDPKQITFQFQRSSYNFIQILGYLIIALVLVSFHLQAADCAGGCDHDCIRTYRQCLDRCKGLSCSGSCLAEVKKCLDRKCGLKKKWLLDFIDFRNQHDINEP